jgi:hypothetical protein
MNQGDMLQIRKNIGIILYKSKIYIFPIKIRVLENKNKNKKHNIVV